jgi:N-acetyl-beta-hexosaminidase
VKLNVLHLHFTEGAFRIQSTVFPELSFDYAADPVRQYSHADVAHIVQYAMLRGIRVIPEVYVNALRLFDI